MSFAQTGIRDPRVCPVRPGPVAAAAGGEIAS